MEKRHRRVFTPDQKFGMLQDIHSFLTVKEGLAKYQLFYSVNQTWERPATISSLSVVES